MESSVPALCGALCAERNARVRREINAVALLLLFSICCLLLMRRCVKGCQATRLLDNRPYLPFVLSCFVILCSF